MRQTTMMNETRTVAAAVENQRDDPGPGRSARRISRMKCLSVVVGLPILMWACGAQPTSLTVPTGSPAFTVSGVVFARSPTGTGLVEGAWVEEAHSHRGATSDKKGFYSIAGLTAGTISLSASASYYYVATITFPISSDANKDIEIEAPNSAFGSINIVPCLAYPCTPRDSSQRLDVVTLLACSSRLSRQKGNRNNQQNP